MSDIKDTLAALSEAATQGALVHHGWGDGSTQMGMTNIFNEDAEVLLMECIPEGDAAFLVALWNTYRSGQLVPVPSVETVARAMCRAPGSLCVGFCHSEHCHEAVAQYGEQATAVIAALAAVGQDTRSQYRHVKRGTTYTVIGEAELQMSADDLCDGALMVVYRGDDGKLWVRSHNEFHDGRFEAIEQGQYRSEG